MRNVIGMRRETVDESERRAPLSPMQVEHVVHTLGVRVIVEPSPQRIFDDAAYVAAGAELSTDLSSCNLVMGVKEIPVEAIHPGGAYCYFSHTIKAQRYNMPMLTHIIDVGATLLDYELVTSEADRRLIFFGDFAGYAGMIDALWALGKRLAWEGVPNPFESIQPAHCYDNLADAETAVALAGERVQREGLPAQVTPLVCIFTGRGRVSKGAQEVFAHLPVVRLRPSDLDSLNAPGGHSAHTVYACELRKPELYSPIDKTRSFDVETFNRNPEDYRGRLHEYAHMATIVINGIYWSPRYPRLLTRQFIRGYYDSGRAGPLRVIGDITCDIEGSIEFTVKATTSDNPVFVYEPATGKVIDGWAGDGPVVLAVDKLPAELPREASQAFGEGLLPFIAHLAAADFTLPVEKLELPAPFAKALIAHQGALTDNFRYLNNCLLRSDAI